MDATISSERFRPTRQLWVIAGPNGAGKSTLVSRRLSGRIPVVNPDELALGLPPGPRREFDAGRLALEARQAHLGAGRSFGFETTLTGRGELLLIRQARELGYKVTLVFVGLSDVQMSIRRVGERVSRGGHNVPVDDLLRRYDRSMANLGRALDEVDRAYLIDNTGRQRRLVLVFQGGRLRRRTSKLPAWAEPFAPA